MEEYCSLICFSQFAQPVLLYTRWTTQGTYHNELGTVACTINQGNAAQLFSWAFSQLMFPHTLIILAHRKLNQEDHNFEQAYKIQVPSCSFLPKENIWFYVTFYIFIAYSLTPISKEPWPNHQNFSSLIQFSVNILSIVVQHNNRS